MHGIRIPNKQKGGSALKKLIMLLTAGAIILSCAAAEPLKLAPDLEDSIRIKLNEQAEYVYSFCYPQVEAADEASELINSFYRYKADDARNFEIPMNADYYRTQNVTENVTTEISYSVTCNNDDFFSVLVSSRQGNRTFYAGHTFTRSDLKKGTAISLPYLLGLLDSNEEDEWLRERQTSRSEEAVRRLVWNSLKEKQDGELRPELKEELEFVFFPEEDFYLNEDGSPVFYLQPGIVDESDVLMTFPFTIEEILDEM